MMDVDRIKDKTRGIIIDQIDRGTTVLGSRVGERSANVRTVSESLRGQGYSATADLVAAAASQMDRVSSYLIDSDGERVVHDLEVIARDQPIVTAGVGLLIGLIGARLLKAGARDHG